MPSRFKTQRWASQPPQGVPLDLSHPLLRSCVLFVDPRSGRNLIQPTNPTLTGTRVSPAPAMGSPSIFRGFSSYGAGATDSIGTTYTLSNAGPRSWFFWLMTATSGGSTFGRVFQKSGTGTGSECLFTNAASGTWTFSRYNAAGTRTGENSITHPTLGPSIYSLLITHDDTGGVAAPLAYVNGESVTVIVTAGTAAGVAANATDPIYIGNRAGNDRVHDGIIGYAAVWDRVLSQREAIALTENFWRVFLPMRSRVYAGIAAVAGGFLPGRVIGGAVGGARILGGGF